MLPPCFVVWMSLIGSMVLGAGVVSGQDYPNKPIRIVTSEPGGSADFMTRLIAQGLAGSLGQQVVVENRAGAGGIIAAQTVTKASPDGYTLLLYGSSIWTLPLLQNAPYDPVRDFSPVTLAARAPNILVVHPSVAATSVEELIALAKAQPGALNYGASGTGSTTHLAAELFKAMAGVNIVRIPYKGGGPAVNDLIGARLQLMFATPGSVAPHIESGRLRALAVTSAEPSALAPDLPTVAASGLPGYESVAMWGVFAPAGTPATILNRLNQEIARILKTGNVKERLFNTRIEVVASRQEQLALAVKSEMVRLGKVIKDAGIRAE